MKTFELAGEVRSEVGKKATKAVRSAEAIPCVLYGGKENVHFTVTESAVRKLVYSPDVFVVNLTVWMRENAH
jgi:large subunit ribosomal protein L25